MRKAGVLLVFIFLGIAGFRRTDPPSPYLFRKLFYFPPMPVAASNPVTQEGAALGRFLFYDPILSADSSISCSSCHRQRAAFSDAPNTFSKGFNQSAQLRNTPALFNLAWYPKLFWDGRAAGIEEQVFHPVNGQREMNMQWQEAISRISRSPFYRAKFRQAFGNEVIDSVLIAKAIAQFERTLISDRSKYDRVLKGQDEFTEEEFDGFNIVNDMTKGDCLHCHTTDANALGTILEFSNNGLDSADNADAYSDKGLGTVTRDRNDNGRFKIPSLRNVAITPPYMHDGRFKTLEEVIDFYSEGVHAGSNIDRRMGSARQGGAHLTRQDKMKILVFLRTLTDSVFISSPEYSNPFSEHK